jgi:hypothetical protein
VGKFYAVGHNASDIGIRQLQPFLTRPLEKTHAHVRSDKQIRIRPARLVGATAEVTDDCLVQSLQRFDGRLVRHEKIDIVDVDVGRHRLRVGRQVRYSGENDLE